MPTTGIVLKVERTKANVTMSALAARMGVSRQTLWSLERAAVVDGQRAGQYREALKALRGVTLDEATA
jgi:transcriptional regulator with XRE-family HTH domain